METRAHHVASGRLIPYRERPSHCHQDCYAGFPGLAGFTPARRTKTDPLFWGGRCLRHGPKHTRETRQSRHSGRLDCSLQMRLWHSHRQTLRVGITHALPLPSKTVCEGGLIPAHSCNIVCHEGYWRERNKNSDTLNFRIYSSVRDRIEEGYTSWTMSCVLLSRK
jgi:hypothetical protein